ncbi:MAG: hypothetical protein JWM68_5207 [Verrucomicrobiales bacterium]|nr:hypothetical protein [Verrucomicrobiales bacterium]
MAFNVADYLKAGGDYAGNRLKWTGRPTQQMRQQFVAWIHTVNGQIADLINDKYFYALQFGTPEPEFWIYHPGGKREQVYD